MHHIFIRQKDCLYRFFWHEWNFTGDGSLYMGLARDGEVEDSIASRFTMDGTLIAQGPATKNTKGLRISYHTSGQINYIGVSGGPRYNEPLYHISRINPVVGFSIPEIDHLDAYEKETIDSDLIIDLADEIRGRLTFSVFIIPWDFDPEEIHPSVFLTYKDWFGIVISQHEIPPSIANHIEGERFYYFAVSPSLFNEPTVSEGDALLRFHQKARGTKEIIIYPPNNEGVYTIIFSVPMRIPPRFRIDFFEEGFSAVEVKKTTTSLKFKVKDKHGNFIKRRIPIKGLELDANL